MPSLPPGIFRVGLTAPLELASGSPSALTDGRLAFASDRFSGSPQPPATTIRTYNPADRSVTTLRLWSSTSITQEAREVHTMTKSWSFMAAAGAWFRTRIAR